MVVAVVAVVCFVPSFAIPASSKAPYYNGNRDGNKVSLMFNVYEGADVVEGIIELLNERIYEPISELIPNGNHGIALKNIRKRLEIAYPFKNRLYITNDGEFTSSIIEIELEEEQTC